MSQRESSYDMLPVDDALNIVLNESKSLLQTESKVLQESLGFILADDIYSPFNLPPFPASMKDGYCLSIKDDKNIFNPSLISEYKVLDCILAGCNLNNLNLKDSIASNEVYKIMTGAPIPPSCNTVVMIEKTKVLKTDSNNKEELISILLSELKIGNDVRPIGSDIKNNKIILKKGEYIGPSELGILSSCGICNVLVYKYPSIGILSTGDEIIDHYSKQALLSGQIYDSNRPILQALFKQFNSSLCIKDLGIVPDNEDILFNTIKNSFDSIDILVSSGGVSMGEVDLVKKWMEENGTVHFGRVLMKPGKPLTFASIDINGKKKLMFATPGNPVSSYVTSILFILPCLRMSTGNNNPYHPRVNVHIQHSLRLDPQRPEYHRALIWWDCNLKEFWGQSTGSQASSRLLSMRSANALLELPQSSGILEKGSIVTALIIGDIPGHNFIIPPEPKHKKHHSHHC